MSAESQLLSVVRAAVNEWGRDRRCEVTAPSFLCPGWKYPRYSRAETCQALEWLRRPLPMTPCLRSLAFFRGVRPRTVVGKLVGGGMATWRGLGHSLDRPAVSNPWFGQPSHVEGGCTAARSCLSVPLALYSTLFFLPFRCFVRVPTPSLRLSVDSYPFGGWLFPGGGPCGARWFFALGRASLAVETRCPFPPHQTRTWLPYPKWSARLAVAGRVFGPIVVNAGSSFSDSLVLFRSSLLSRFPWFCGGGVLSVWSCGLVVGRWCCVPFVPPLSFYQTLTRLPSLEWRASQAVAGCGLGVSLLGLCVFLSYCFGFTGRLVLLYLCPPLILDVLQSIRR